MTATNNLTPIGILGGTFDPIHLGHIKIAEATKQKCYLKKIIFIPCNIPAHRYKPIATPAQRLKMTQLAIKDHPNFIVDDREIKRAGTSFMLDTLKSLKQDYPDNPLVLILGLDAFAGLDTWHQWEKLIDYAHLVVVNRAGVKIELPAPIKTLLQTTEVFDAKALQTKQNGLIYQLHIDPIPISATKIRQQLRDGQTPIDTLAENVYNYIRKKEIYYDQNT